MRCLCTRCTLPPTRLLITTTTTPFGFENSCCTTTRLKKIYGKVNEKGYSLVPLRLYFSHGKVKISLGMAKGKRKVDKRDTIRDRDQKRDLDRAKKDY